MSEESRKFGIGLLSVMGTIYPPPVCALLLTQIAGRLCEKQEHRKLEALLYKMWSPIQSRIAEDVEKLAKSDPGLMVASLFIEQYFAHSGDWGKAKAKLYDVCLKKWPERRVELEDLMQRDFVESICKP